MEQTRHQLRKAGLLPQDQQLLLRAQNGSASARSREVAGQVRAASVWQRGRVGEAPQAYL